MAKTDPPHYWQWAGHGWWECEYCDGRTKQPTKTENIGPCPRSKKKKK